MRLLYLCLGHILVPFVFLREVWRAWRDPSFRPGLGSRFGCGRQLAPGTIWVHAVSVGEVQAAGALLRALAAEYPSRSLLVTASTATGKRQAERLYADIADIRYLPYDLPGAVGRFLDRVRPVAVVPSGPDGSPMVVAQLRPAARRPTSGRVARHHSRKATTSDGRGGASGSP